MPIRYALFDLQLSIRFEAEQCAKVPSKVFAVDWEEDVRPTTLRTEEEYLPFSYFNPIQTVTTCYTSDCLG